MIKTITSKNSTQNAALLTEMFRARKYLFGDRLGWKVEIDDEGREIDRFDRLSPVYIVDVDERNRHRGSVRLLPTTGDTLLRDRFADVLDGVAMRSPTIWEYTRLCVVDHVGTDLRPHEIESVTVDLLLGICETCLAAGVGHVVGSIDRQMADIFQRCGWSPELLGQNGKGKNAVYLGVWDVTERNAAILREAGAMASPA